MAGKKRAKGTSPRLTVRITPEQYENAKRSHSGACLIADAIKRDYPHLTGISVDMATIRVTDKAAGERYTYLTTPRAQQTLLFFDQGWATESSTDQFPIQQAVKIDRIVRSRGATAKRRQRKQELTAKRDSGQELSPSEKRSLSIMEKNEERPASREPAQVVANPERGPATIRGGAPIAQGKAHANLLRGRNRHFGAKLADPGIAFQEAVDQAVRLREEQLDVS